MVPIGEMSSILTFPKLNGNNYYAWADNMMSALQARLLWLIVDGQQPSPPKPSANPPVDATTNKLLPFSSDDYKEWIRLQNAHIQWLESDLAAMGLMREAIKFGQCEHIQSATSSKEMWDRLRQLHVTQRQDTNIHYYFQELYLKKWDKCTSMLDHIGSFLNLKCHIVEAGHKLDDILVVHAILHSLSHTNIWDIIRRNLLEKGKGLTLDILSAELISVHDYSECDCLANEKENMLKSEQTALFTKSSLSSTHSEKKLQSHHHLLPTLKRNLGEVNQTTNLQFILPAPNAISVAKRVIGPLSAILNLSEEMILTILKVLQTLLLNTQYL